MQLARITGHATSTVKHPTLDGWRLLLCQPLDPSMQPTGDPMLSLDRLGAGPGDTVLITSDGKALREMIGSKNTPARWFTLGLIDEPTTQ